MRIAQIAPLQESVPPRAYGGTERVVSWLTERLVQDGHEVTLFASGDSRTAAELIPVCEHALRGREADPIAWQVLQLQRVLDASHRFDVLHFHVDSLHLPLCRLLALPRVTTMHGRLDLFGLAPLFTEFTDEPLVSISNAQRQPVPHANWRGTVHHGLPRDLLSQGPGSGGYLAFLGRISPEKGADRAIAIAQRAGLPLRIAAKVDRVDKAYFDAVVRPLLSAPGTEFIGEIGDSEKAAFLGDASALLMPIEWPEPFGLVMIEALACGTPVVAFDRGSVREILTDGVDGYICDDIDSAVAAVRRLDRIDRNACRATFEERFTVERMAMRYVSIYQEILEQANAHHDPHDTWRGSVPHRRRVAQGG